LQCVAARCSVLQCVAVCCSVLQCVAVRCSTLQCVVGCHTINTNICIEYIIEFNTNIHMYVCILSIYICTIYMHIYIYVCTHTYIRIHIHTCTDIYSIYIYMHYIYTLTHSDHVAQRDIYDDDLPARPKSHCNTLQHTATHCVTLNIRNSLCGSTTCLR